MKLKKKKVRKIIATARIAVYVCFVFSIYSAFEQASLSQIAIENESRESYSRLFHFIGFYLGNGLPRFLVYAFCACLIIYKFDQFHESKWVGNPDKVNHPDNDTWVTLLLLGGVLVIFLFIWSANVILLSVCYFLVMLLEFGIYRTYLYYADYRHDIGSK
jgi:hypothetical protein